MVADFYLFILSGNTTGDTQPEKEAQHCMALHRRWERARQGLSNAVLCWQCSRERESTSSITRWMNHPVALENKARRIPLFSPTLVKHLVFSCSVIVAIKTDKCRTVCRFTKQKYGTQIILLALWERTSVLFHKYTLVANSLI